MISQSMLAQGSGSIRGRVYDKKTGEPLPGANVTIPNTALGAATGLEGSYAIRNIPASRQKIRAAYIGYVPVTADVEIIADSVLEKDFRLVAQSLTGEEVVVTAQAQGQNSAINQQLASNTIANIVAADRIKELPDVNAAESVGRLPGVSISRSGGEATQVAIRGLSPKYNTVTINGVVVPATGGDDRSVDLSLISSSMLDGIELKKANTADMDADVLGGTVDLKLREAGDQLQLNATIQPAAGILSQLSLHGERERPFPGW
jgi:hypothetical protein